MKTPKRRMIMTGISVLIALSIVALIAVPMILNSQDDEVNVSPEAHRIAEEFRNVELVVASIIHDPNTNIVSLNPIDSRIVSIVDCGSDVYNPLALTQDMTDGGLIDICTTQECIAGRGTPMPISEYLSSDTTISWFCVCEDGRIEGYTENCVENDDIDCHDVRIRDF